MRIAFNGIGCGWGNNGGTQSVFRMAEALASLGHEVEVWSHCANKFTWFPLLKVEHVQTRLADAPAVDVLIASGCATVQNTYDYPRKKVGVQWLRAHETWAYKEEKLFELYRLDMPLWVNSEWMKILVRDKILRDGVEVQYCGVPIDEFRRGANGQRREFSIGALYSKKPRKRFKDIDALMRLFPAKYFIYGNEDKNLDGYIRQPSMEAKCELYRQCDVWIACSENEGLHIPPMEAALCGAAVVANNKLSAGNMDYCVQGTTALMYDSGDVKAMCRLLEQLKGDPHLREFLNHNMQHLIRSKIGTVEENAEKLIERLK